MSKLAMVIDKKRCIGCHGCAVACKSENNLPNNVWWNKVITETGKGKTGENISQTMDSPTGTLSAGGDFVNKPGNINITKDYYTLSCQHCEDAPCIKACAYNATYHKISDGTVQIDSSKCIGCGLCITACPYGVRVQVKATDKYYVDFKLGSQGIMPHKVNTVEKCTLCSHRIDNMQQPACVEVCPGIARFVGDINDPSSTVSKKLNNAKQKGRTIEQLKLDQKTKPSVYFIK